MKVQSKSVFCKPVRPFTQREQRHSMFITPDIKLALTFSANNYGGKVFKIEGDVVKQALPNLPTCDTDGQYARLWL